MLKANEQQVAHTTNIDLVAIRNAEISYFSNFFTNFGTQCALIAGFILSSISQVPGLDASCNIFWKYFYWISTAISFVTSMHVLLCTVFIAVYGQGLALRGPVGSMVRAVDGMVIEQLQVVSAFVITIISFTMSTVGTYWIMMDSLGAILSSIITLIGMGFWYHYTLRIYNRFKWEKEDEITWADDDDDGPSFLPKSLREPSTRKLPSSNPSATQNSSPSNSKSPSSILGNLFGMKSKDKSSNDSTNGGVENPMQSTEIDLPGVHSGYLTMKINSDNYFGSDNYKRVFLHVENHLLFVYADKKTFERNPQQMLRKRAVDLENYSLMLPSPDEVPVVLQLMLKTDLSGKNEDTSSPVDSPSSVKSTHTRGLTSPETTPSKNNRTNSSNTSANNNANGNTPTMLSEKKPLEFRCDTMAEASVWISVFQSAVKNPVLTPEDTSDYKSVDEERSVRGGGKTEGSRKGIFNIKSDTSSQYSG